MQRVGDLNARGEARVVETIQQSRRAIAWRWLSIGRQSPGQRRLRVRQCQRQRAAGRQAEQHYWGDRPLAGHYPERLAKPALGRNSTAALVCAPGADKLLIAC